MDINIARNINIVRDFNDLKNRVDSYLNIGNVKNREIKKTLTDLNKMGEVAIFGGMLRDIALYGYESFDSDVDVVIKLHRPENTIDDELGKLDVEFHNNSCYNGKKIILPDSTLDVWPVECTWAFRNKKVSGDVFVTCLILLSSIGMQYSMR